MIGAKAAIVGVIGAAYYLDIKPDSVMLVIGIGGGGGREDNVFVAEEAMYAPEFSLSDAVVVAAA